MRVTTNEERNAQIKEELLRSNTPMSVYAAARIAELEQHNAALLEHIRYMHTESER